MGEQQDAEKEALKTRQSAEIKSLKERNEAALEGIDIRKKAELKALTEINSASTKASTLKDVNKALDELNEYADKTIYNFAEMTRNIGTFTAAGVDLDTSVLAIKGIANLAAVSGSTSYQASTAMYQLSQALASGTVKLQDWNSVVNAGMGGQVFQDALKETARVHGIAIDEMIMEAGSFRETLEKGWLTSEVLTETLSKFTGDLNEEQLRTMGYTEEQIKSIIKMGQTANDAATKIKTVSQLYDTLKEAAGSGWAKTWQIIIGDFEEAKELLTLVGQTLGGFIDRASDARNEMLQFWKDNGGRDAIIQAISNAFSGLKQILTPVIESFKEVFPPLTGEKLVAFSNGLEELSEKFKISDETADKLKRTFAGLFSIIGFVCDAFKFLIGVAAAIVYTVSPIGGKILGITAAIGDFIVKLRDSASAGDIFTKGLAGIREFLNWVADGVKDAVKRIGDYFAQFGGIDLGPLEIFSDRTKVLFKPFTFMAEMVAKAFSAIKAVFDWLEPYFSGFATGVSNVFKKIGGVVGNATGTMGFDGFLGLINTVLTGGVLIGLKKFLDSLTEITNGAGGFLSNLTGILDGVRGSLEAYQTKLKAGAMLSIAIAIGVLAAALWVLSSISVDEMTTALVAITVLFTELSAVMLVLSNNMGAVKLGAVSIQMMAIATAILILSAACKNLSGLSWDEMARGLLGIAVLLASLIGFEQLIGDGKGLLKIGFALIPLSTGLLIMSQAVRSFAGLEWEELAKGLIGVGSALLIFIGFEKLIGDGSGLLRIGIALIPLSTGILILAQAIKSLSGLEWEELIKGLTGIGGALLAVSLLSQIVKPAPILAMGAAMVGIGTGMLVMAGAITILGNMPLGELIKGLVGVAGVLAALAAASKLISPITLLAMGAALVGVGAALNLIAAAMLITGNMSLGSIAKSLIALGGALGILAIAMKAMQSAIAGAAALMAVSAALAVLVPSLVILGMMDLENIGMMLLALVGVFGTFAVAALLLAPITPIMLALSAAIALLGGGVLMLGAGLGMCAVAIAAFAAAGTAGIVAVTAMVASLIGLIPMALKSIGEGLALLIAVLVETVPDVLKIVGTLLAGIINLIIENTPKFMEMIGVLLTEALALILEYVPKIVDVVLKTITGILNAIAENIDDIIRAAVSIIEALLKGIAESVPRVVSAIFEMLEAIAKEIGLFIPRLVDLGFTLIISFLDGMTETIEKNTKKVVDSAWAMAEAIIDGICYFFETSGPKLREAMDRVATAIWNAFKEFFGIHSPSKLSEGGAGQIIQGIIDGLLGGISKAADAIKDVASSIWNGFKDFFGIKSPSTLMKTEGGQVTAGIKEGIEGGEGELNESAVGLGEGIFNGIKGAVEGIGDVASNVVNTLGDGLKNGLSSIGDAAKNVGSSILGGIKDVLGINSPARTMIEAAHYTGQGLIVGLEEMAKPVANAAEDVGNGAIDSMKKSLSAVSDVVDADMDLSPTIRPVIDMSDVENGLNSTFSEKQTLNVADIKSKAAAVANNQNGKDRHMEEMAGTLVDANNVSNGKIISAIESLKNDFTDLMFKFGQLQVVMDTGTLVGAIGPEMDRELGGLSNMTRRGVR